MAVAGDDDDDVDVEIHENAVVKFVEKLGFDNIQKLGEGGMGLAYRGRFRPDGTTRVLKLNKASTTDTANDDLLEEGSRLRSLAHPHVAVLYDLQKNTDAGGIKFSYLNMEYCKGGDLHHRCLAVHRCFNVWSFGLKFGFKFGFHPDENMFQESIIVVTACPEFRTSTPSYCG